MVDMDKEWEKLVNDGWLWMTNANWWLIGVHYWLMTDSSWLINCYIYNADEQLLIRLKNDSQWFTIGTMTKKVVGWWWFWLYQTAYRGLSKPRWYVVHIDLPTKGTAQGFLTQLRWKNSEFVMRYCQSIPKSQPWLLLFNVIPIRFSWWKHWLSLLDDRWLMVAPRLSEFCGFGVRSSQRIQRRGF